jgi:4-aminobutyrate aminotransferase and related aminotransferases
METIQERCSGGSNLLHVAATEKHRVNFEDLESNVRSYTRSLISATFVRAKDARLFTDQGESYIDFLAGAGALNYGHNPSALKTALLDYIQLDGVTHGLDMQVRARRSCQYIGHAHLEHVV